MGTFNAGVFDNDSALDLLDELVKHLENEVGEIDSSAFAVEDTELALAAADILATLCEKYDARPPPKERVQRWRQRFLKVWDDGIDGLSPTPEYKAKRRPVIEQTFDKLLRLAERSDERDF